MKIGLSNISFQKTLIAKTQVLENNQPKQAFIYQLDKPQDYDYFDKTLDKQEEWQEALLFQSTKRDIKKDDYEIFVLEDDKENCLGYVSTHDCDDIDYGVRQTAISKLETIPNCKYFQSDRRIKHIGKTLIDFIKILKCEKDNRDIWVSSPFEPAIDFYKKKGFEGDWYGMRLVNLGRNNYVKMEFMG